ncbi:prolyl oligopeptidase family serine peptidase [Rhizocola hellebori]|nr:prolyl oligopeptidase family serine peptidase [Rhizocola hellebori]
MVDPSEDVDSADEFAWLEDVDSVAALEWVRQRNAETLAALAGTPSFLELQSGIRQVYDSDARIPYPTWRGDYFYSFWQDESNPRGLWRRATLAEYRKPDPQWEVLLDVDALAAQEDVSWAWNSAAVQRPHYERALISLSRGGADAAVVREFDLRSKGFVADGFTLPEAKSRVSWIDDDHIFVGTDFSAGTLTSSGYPRVVKRWRRGTALSEAQTIFSGELGDVSVEATHHATPGYERSFVRRFVDFFNAESYLLDAGDQLIRLDLPTDAVWEAHHEWLLVRLRTAWQVAGFDYPAGALLVTGFEEFLGGSREFTVLYRPQDNSALKAWAWTKQHLIVGLLVDVASRLEVYTPTAAGWQRRPLDGVPDLGHSWIADTEPETTDSYLVACDGYLEPPTLRLGQIDGATEEIKRGPSFFATDAMTTRQFFATSDDGTKVPYFVVGAQSAAPGRVLMTGYGGFAQAKTPEYDGSLGRGWLARGGTYVVANIRGGGEYGPRWHHAALRELRPRAFEDFAAVAQDLVQRGITTPSQLGIFGRSNGGLLMGAMLTRYPEKFGAIAIGVPLLDMRRYHRLLAGASWMAEYGDPDNAEDWAYLRTFSPYHLVSRGQPYPPVLLFTSTRDDRVHPGHARKMAARLKSFGYDVTYYENVEGGHASASDNKQKAFMTALRLDFLWQHTG